ncbi:MAG TPA: decaprenyl-phosphate phosphoribosyltransferase [Streptosporangiaceae bacterium]|nr:decaprenyl-phosphate phosphoribosyltransferase [Streptosporangiaceae bacterium]
MTTRVRAAEVPPAGSAALPGSPVARWVTAVVQTARPRQWPKNLLVFAAPLAGASLGRDDGLGYALVAAAVFTAAAAAVYFVNDVADAERDRLHPVKRSRAVASGRLSRSHALALAGLAIAAAVAASLWIGVPMLAVLVSAYIALSILYTLVLKHVPVIELLFVAAGFLLRVLAGATATRVPPSAWFLAVCSLGALMVAIAKRFTELAVLGPEAATHRPVMRWYTPGLLRLSQRVASVIMITAYLLWAYGQHGAGTRTLHLVSALPLAAALLRFDWLTAHEPGKPVEDLISRDRLMIGCELAWLGLFVGGLM